MIATMTDVQVVAVEMAYVVRLTPSARLGGVGRDRMVAGSIRKSGRPAVPCF